MADLLTSIRAEIGARLRELEPAIAEFGQLSTAAQALAEEGSGASEPVKRGRPAKPGRSAKTDSPAKTGRSVKPAAPRRSAHPSATPADEAVRAKARTAKPTRRARGREGAHTPTGQAILAALEHGSHTVAELVLVSALPAGDIRESLRQLRKRKAVVKTDRDGRSAYALPPSAA